MSNSCLVDLRDPKQSQLLRAQKEEKSRPLRTATPNAPLTNSNHRRRELYDNRNSATESDKGRVKETLFSCAPMHIGQVQAYLLKQQSILAPSQRVEAVSRDLLPSRRMTMMGTRALLWNGWRSPLNNSVSATEPGSKLDTGAEARPWYFNLSDELNPTSNKDASRNSSHDSDSTGYGSQCGDLLNVADSFSVAERSIDEFFSSGISEQRDGLYDFDAAAPSEYSGDYVASTTVSEASIDELYRRASEFYDLDASMDTTSLMNSQSEECFLSTAHDFNCDIDDVFPSFSSTLVVTNSQCPTSILDRPSKVNSDQTKRLKAVPLKKLASVSEEEHFYEEIGNDSDTIDFSGIRPPALPPKRPGSHPSCRNGLESNDSLLLAAQMKRVLSLGSKLRRTSTS